MDFVYVHLGAPDRLMDNLERRVPAGFIAGNRGEYSVWHPSYAPGHRSERSKAYVRAAGFVDFWRAKGWPDLCHPIGADVFACD